VPTPSLSESVARKKGRRGGNSIPWYLKKRHPGVQGNSRKKKRKISGRGPLLTFHSGEGEKEGTGNHCLPTSEEKGENLHVRHR